MGFRDTGETVTKEEKVVEQFCDQCKKTIPENQYPELDLQIDEGDWPESITIYHFCCFPCVTLFAARRARQQ